MFICLKTPNGRPVVLQVTVDGAGVVKVKTLAKVGRRKILSQGVNYYIIMGTFCRPTFDPPFPDPLIIYRVSNIKQTDHTINMKQFNNGNWNKDGLVRIVDTYAVQIEMQDGYRVLVENCDSYLLIEGLKNMIRHLNHSHDLSALTLDDRVLDDQQSLKDCGITICDVLRTKWSSEPNNRKRTMIHIYVKTLAGKTINFDVHPQDTVYSLKQAIRQSEGTPEHQMRLIFHERSLEDYRSLQYYGITNESTLHLVLRLRGE